jgi:hypothetical protein
MDAPILTKRQRRVLAKQQERVALQRKADAKQAAIVATVAQRERSARKRCDKLHVNIVAMQRQRDERHARRDRLIALIRLVEDWRERVGQPIAYAQPAAEAA